jgi:hypothetical protein
VMVRRTKSSATTRHSTWWPRRCRCRLGGGRPPGWSAGRRGRRYRPALLEGEAKPAAPPKPSGAPPHLLMLMQRGDGRFLDCVLENVYVASDEQVAAAVRAMQPVWQRGLREHLVLEPVRSEEEGSTVEVPPGFDPSAILLTGNVTGQPPFRGTLEHPRRRVKEIKLPPPPTGRAGRSRGHAREVELLG